MGEAPEMSPRARLLTSLDHADHPNAVPLGECALHAHTGGGERCAIKRVHQAHPYGAIHPRGGLAHWCIGRTV